MNATIVPDNNLHFPVLLKEVLSIISPQNGGTFIDCTFGQGGYTREILKNKYNKVIGIDRDYESLKVTSNYDKVIALGNVASNSLKKLNIDHFKMPHPSGLNRQLNDKEFEKTKIKECYNYLYT